MSLPNVSALEAEIAKKAQIKGQAAYLGHSAAINGASKVVNMPASNATPGAPIKHIGLRRAKHHRAWAGSCLGTAFGLFGLLALTVPSMPASAAILTQGSASGSAGGSTCLDVAYDNIAAGTRVGPVTCNAGPAEQVSWNYVTVYTMGGQRCLDTAGGSTSSGVAIVSNTCNAKASTQQWYYYFGQVVNIGAGECLDTGGAVNGGSQLHLEPCNGSVTQNWQIK
jgi:hypothetical protein